MVIFCTSDQWNFNKLTVLIDFWLPDIGVRSVFAVDKVKSFTSILVVHT